MKKIEKIINDRSVSILKNKPTKILIEFYKKTAKERQNIKLSIKNELDFFNAAILLESFKNKSLFEETYERERKELSDLWPNLSYQEKNKLINLKLTESKKRCRSFKSSKGKRIWIAFFDELLNTLYDKEMNIFDLDQYFNLYKDFKQRMIPSSSYGIQPYAAEFIDIKQIHTEDHKVLFYYDPLKALFIVQELNDGLTLKKLALRCDYQYQKSDHPLFIEIIKTYENQQIKELIDILLNSELISNRVRKSLNKLRTKIQ